MIIGVPKEIKPQENRIGAVPAMVLDLVEAGHTVLVEKDGGLGAGVTDAEYASVGGQIAATAADVYGQSDMIIKVKEPLAAEYPLIKKDQLLFTYFHFAASRELTDAMVSSGAHCFAYETLIHRNTLPLLTPMSEVAGRMSVQVGAVCLEKHMGGRGILLGGIPGVEPAKVVILGGGVVGTNAAKMAAGLGADVTMMDIDLDRLRYLDDVMAANVTMLHSSPIAIREQIATADMPGAVPRTSTFGLTNATGPWAKKLANMGVAEASRDDVLRTAANVLAGKITHEGVAEAFDLDFTDPAKVL
jgi:alanine dehydrogenase